MSVPSLYTICFDYIKNHTEELVSLDGVPYKPTVENIVKYLFTTDIPLNKSILAILPQSHSDALRTANLTWTRIMFQSLPCSVHPRLMTLSREFPHFITHLKIGTIDICDDDIYLFANFTNLTVLDLSESQHITDRTVSYITTLALSQLQHRGLIHLKELYFNGVKGVTDKSLKFFGKLNNLQKLYLTGTSVTEDVAKSFLTSKGFIVYTKKKIPYFTERLLKMNFKLHQFIETCSCEYPIPPNRKMHDYSKSNNTVGGPILDFYRDTTKSIPEPIKRKVQKRPMTDDSIIYVKRPKVGDFLAMLNNELKDE